MSNLSANQEGNPGSGRRLRITPVNRKNELHLLQERATTLEGGGSAESRDDNHPDQWVNSSTANEMRTGVASPSVFLRIGLPGGSSIK